MDVKNEKIYAVLRLLRFLRRENTFDLRDVIQIVPCKHPHDVLHGLFAALGVHPVMLPLFRRERFVKRQICFAQHAELLSRSWRRSRLA